MNYRKLVLRSLLYYVTTFVAMTGYQLWDEPAEFLADPLHVFGVSAWFSLFGLILFVFVFSAVVRQRRE